MNSMGATVLHSVRTRLTQLVPHVDRALSQLPAKAAAPAQRLFAQSKLVVNRLVKPSPASAARAADWPRLAEAWATIWRRTRPPESQLADV